MSIPRPKILTCVTVPAGGWAWDIDISMAAQYDTNLTGTVPAGDYFVAGDNQSDDLLYALQDSIQTQVTGAGGASKIFIAGLVADTHNIIFQFYSTGFVDATGDNDVRLNLSAWAAGLLGALGFDSADVASTATDNPTFTSDWHHGYGWYADEDGLLGDHLAEDINDVNVLRSRAIDGGVITQFIGDQYDNLLALQFVPRDYIYSQGVRYGAANVHPYERNQGLECWWMGAREGNRFRVYRDGRAAVAIAADTGVSTAATATTMTDAGKSWSLDPNRWVGRLFYRPLWSWAVSQMFYISSHTATVLTVPNAHPSGLDVDGNGAGAAGMTYYMLDHTYQTYVIGDMTRFEPRELPAIDRYNISIPLFRYVA